MEGKTESKWWSLCCGSLKACGLSVSLYRFLFCECVCVCVRQYVPNHYHVYCVWLSSHHEYDWSFNCRVGGRTQQLMALGQHYISISGLTTAFTFSSPVLKWDDRGTMLHYSVWTDLVLRISHMKYGNLSKSILTCHQMHPKAQIKFSVKPKPKHSGQLCA